MTLPLPNSFALTIYDESWLFDSVRIIRVVVAVNVVLLDLAISDLFEGSFEVNAELHAQNPELDNFFLPKGKVIFGEELFQL